MSNATADRARACQSASEQAHGVSPPIDGSRSSQGAAKPNRSHRNCTKTKHSGRTATSSFDNQVHAPQSPDNFRRRDVLGDPEAAKASATEETESTMSTNSTVMTGNGPRAFFESGLQAEPTPFESIPVIDFAALTNGGDLAARSAVGAAVRQACTEVGFFYAVGHGVSEEVIERTFSAAHAFFDLPLDSKLAISVEKSDAMRGYTPLLGENTDPANKGDLHEGFDLALDLDEDDPDVKAGVFGYAPNQWPTGLPGFREALLDYHNEVRIFGERIFQAFALALELPEDFFAERITKPMAHMRVLHYPSQEGAIDERQIGIGAHSDYECFTMLCTDDVPALQVLNSAGKWVMAPPMKGAFIVNVGDMMARWTNDYFCSTIHRAINASGRRRYSIPFFFGVNSREVIEVLPSCQSPQNPPRYEPIEAGEYIRSRFDDTYAHRKETSE